MTGPGGERLDATDRPAAPDTGATDRAAALLALGAIPLVVWVCAELRHDDAYITFQYARNWAEGRGLSFNPGEAVLGTTTPLFTAILALSHLLLPLPLESAALGISALAIAVQAWSLYALLRPELPATGLVLCAACALGGLNSLPWVALETNLYGALALACLWADRGRREALAGILLGAAFLCRYDAALLAVALVAARRLEGRALPYRSLLVAALVATPWLLYATVVFGSPLPNTLAAKAGWSDSGDYALATAGSLLRIPGLGSMSPAGGDAQLLALPALLAGLALVWRRARSLLPLVIFAALLFAAYTAIAPPIEHNWHTYLPRLSGNALTVIGAAGGLEWLGQRRGWSHGRSAVVALGCVLAASLLVQALRYRRDVDEAFWLGERTRRYREVSAWLRAHAHPDATLLAEEVGALGYQTRLRMLDPYGLVALPEDRAAERGLAAFAPLLRRRRPELVLIDDGPPRCWLQRATPYRPVQVFAWPPRAPGAAVEHPNKWAVLAARDAGALRSPTAFQARVEQSLRLGARCGKRSRSGDSGGPMRSPPGGATPPSRAGGGVS